MSCGNEECDAWTCSHGSAPPRLTRTGKPVHSTAEKNRAWKAANAAAGGCHDCKQPKLPGRARCERCQQLHAVQEFNRRVRRAFLRICAEPAGSTSLGEESRVEAKDQ